MEFTQKKLNIYGQREPQRKGTEYNKEYREGSLRGILLTAAVDCHPSWRP